MMEAKAEGICRAALSVGLVCMELMFWVATVSSLVDLGRKATSNQYICKFLARRGKVCKVEVVQV